jgi:hypothetical protein
VMKKPIVGQVHDELHLMVVMIGKMKIEIRLCSCF